MWQLTEHVEAVACVKVCYNSLAALYWEQGACLLAFALWMAGYTAGTGMLPVGLRLASALVAGISSHQCWSWLSSQDCCSQLCMAAWPRPGFTYECG